MGLLHCSGVATVNIPGVELVKAGTWNSARGDVTITPADLAAMVTEIGAAVQARTGNGPGPGRTRRMLSTVLIPVPAAAPEPGAS
mgnify:CR=1 FL=1